MSKYRLSNVAKEDLIRIHQFGITQADQYFETIFEYFDLIAKQPFTFEAVDFIKPGYRRCVCGSGSIYYRVENNIVEIMTIIGKQDLSNI